MIVRIAIHKRSKAVRDRRSQRSTGVLGVYMRERGYAEVRPPSRVIVAAAERQFTQTPHRQEREDYQRTVNVGPSPAGQE